MNQNKCWKCHELCDIIITSEFEPYEFWGSRGFEKIETPYSICCGSEIYKSGEFDD